MLTTTGDHIGVDPTGWTAVYSDIISLISPYNPVRGTITGDGTTTPLDVAPRVIVADGYDWSRRSLLHLIRDTLPEAAVIEAVDVSTATEAFRSGCTFVIVDYDLKETGGLTLVETIRAEDSIVPVVLISESINALDDGFAAGINSFMYKEGLASGLAALLRLYHSPRSWRIK